MQTTLSHSREARRDARSPASTTNTAKPCSTVAAATTTMGIERHSDPRRQPYSSAGRPHSRKSAASGVFRDRQRRGETLRRDLPRAEICQLIDGYLRNRLLLRLMWLLSGETMQPIATAFVSLHRSDRAVTGIIGADEFEDAAESLFGPREHALCDVGAAVPAALLLLSSLAGAPPEAVGHTASSRTSSEPVSAGRGGGAGTGS
jgi:hypothetical protein